MKKGKKKSGQFEDRKAKGLDFKKDLSQDLLAEYDKNSDPSFRIQILLTAILRELKRLK